jgi:hypothetical protein
MVVVTPAAARERDRSGHRASDFLPFLITLLAGAIVVVIVSLALGGTSPRRPSVGSLPPPSPTATPAVSIGPTHARSPLP